MARVLSAPADLARLAAGGLALGYGSAALAVARGPGELTTYAGRSWLAAAAFATAGLALVLAGVATSLARRAGRSGDIALLAGYAWFAPLWAGWKGGPPLVVSIAALAAGFALPLLVHVVAAQPGGTLRGGAARALVLAVYLEAAAVALGRALFRDPFFDPTCWENCTDNVFLAHSLPGLARALHDVDSWFALVAAAALAALCGTRLIGASRPARYTLWPLLGGGIVLAAATATHAIALMRVVVEDPGAPAFRAAFAAACAAAILIALGLVWALGVRRVQRIGVARVAAELGAAPRPGSLERALAEALRDPDLQVAYWLPAARRYVDGHGEPVPEPAPAPGRAVTPLVRDGRRVALVAHAAGIAELERELGAAVRLAIENERLQAEVLAQLHDLRASRARIVATGDAERRRLERDLHDGAQQRLLALSFDLRLARAAATGGELAAPLDAAGAETATALDELRELAHGIYPAVLTEAGLGPALASLADTAPLPVELEEIDAGRPPPAVETTAYVIVSEAIEDAQRREATHLVARVRHAGGRLAIELADDGVERTGGLPRVADRIGALGGELELGPTTIVAEIPCA